jgi:hypothetical protein
MALGKSDATSQKRVAVLIATLLVLIVVGLVGGIIWYNFEKSSALSVVAAKRLLEESGDATLRRVELFYEPVVTIVALGSRVPELSEMSARDKDERLALVLTGLRRYPQLFSLYVGYENGEFDMVTRIGGDERSDARQALGAPDNAVFAHETIRVDSDGTRHAGWSFLDESGAQIVERAAADATYDPRSRQWYRLARADGKVHRSDPYIFASSHEIGITLSRKLDGASAGVFAADLAVRDVSSFLAEKKITPSSVAFLFNDRGEVVAYPDDSKIQRTVKDAQESTLLPTTIVVPVDEIIGPINRIRSDALVYSVAVLLLVLPLYVTLVFVWFERQLRRGSYSIGDLHDLGADDPR